MRVGFIGLGVMGRPMAEQLVRAGHSLSLNRVKAASQHLVDLGAVSCVSPVQLRANRKPSSSWCPTRRTSRRSCSGRDGLAEGLSAGKLVIDMSSISPVATKHFASRIEKLGCSYVDAPVSGGEVGAKNATLSIMVGGSQEAFDRALPLLQAMGKNITLIGGVGDGQTAKVANQIIVGLNIEAVAEALLFASRAGADPARVRDALLGGFASSKVLEVHGERMIKKTFDPGFRLRLHRKDLSLAIDAAKALEIALPNTAATQQLMNAALALGDGDRDHSALIRTLEALSPTK